MSFRIAIGACNCAAYAHTRDPLLQELCRRILGRMLALGSLSAEALAALPATRFESERIESRSVSFVTSREELPSKGTLVVVQGFLPSWRFPRYFGPAGTGFMVAEGLVSYAGKPHVPAPDKLLWEYR